MCLLLDECDYICKPYITTADLRIKVYVILIAVEIALVEIEPEKNQACAGAAKILKIP